MRYKVTVIGASYHDDISYISWRDVTQWVLQLNDPLVFVESRRGLAQLRPPRITASGPGETMLLLKYSFMLEQAL